MAGEITNYQYYGLVGQGVAQASSSLIRGFSTAAALSIQAGGYEASAEMLEIQAEQETINAQAQANTRWNQYNTSASANVAVMAAMGKTGENVTIDDASYEAAFKDASLMKTQGKLKNISARSAASAQRSAAKQAEIGRDAAIKIGIAGGVSGAAGAVGSYSMLA